MLAREITCKVIEKKWLTPTVMSIRFEPSRRIVFDPGQFISIYVPNGAGQRPLRRAYSFATSGRDAGYELCVKLYDHGKGSGYLTSLKVGESFRATAPYGDFQFQPRPGRNVCFISTGTGISPIRSILLSEFFQENFPRRSVSIFGARAQDELLYPGVFEALGIQVVQCLSQPQPGWSGFTGRVTDYLKSLPADWGWHSTDFYICGNGRMVEEVRRILLDGRGVPAGNVFQEVYFAAVTEEARPSEVVDLDRREAA